VLGTPKIREALAWFRDTLGFICSDDVYAGDKDNLIRSFNRCDRGEEYVDHHSLFVLANPPHAGLNHISFEVYDVDDVFMEHEHLRGKGQYEHMGGIGRHTLGSQIYDDWADPWGRVHEHWADSDRINIDNGSNLEPAEIGLASQWGERVPEKMLTRVTP
jgi:catechol 2,3-dioxygenase-like lactoylglutathione lyase family enzyme